MSFLGSFAKTIYQMSFQLSPIILTGGIANNLPGGILPIVAITEALNFLTGLLSGGQISLDNFFANFTPLPGASVISNQIGMYPFANQSVAGNAIIAQPLKISMLMHCPARGELGYAAKTATMLALVAALKQHNQLGGTYVVATPSYFYTNCILTDMTDASSGHGHQVQNAWRFDFVRPLLTLEEAEGAQNSLMSKLSGGTEVPAADGEISWSGLEPTVGDPSSVSSSELFPVSSGPVGAGLAPTTLMA